MRDIKQLHPELQKKIAQLQELCKAQGITIGISECLRTKAEQDALYAKGRTTGGSIVTNCKGSTYSSMHQWGVAFDFYLKVDVDGDGKTSDDAFNDATGLFEKVGKIGLSVLSGAVLGSHSKINHTSSYLIGVALQQSSKNSTAHRRSSWQHGRTRLRSKWIRTQPLRT